MDCESISVCTILLDINAADGPNVGGRDLFTFKINAAKMKFTTGILQQLAVQINWVPVVYKKLLMTTGK